MRGFITGLVLALMLVPVAQAGMPVTIGASSVGYGATSPDQGTLFTSFWAGIRGKVISEKTALYGCYQHLGANGGPAGDGAKLLLVSGSKNHGVSLLSDFGVASNLAKDSDGELATALTVGGGASWALTEYISPFIYGSAYDSGPRFTWSVQFGLAVSDIQRLAGVK